MNEETMLHRKYNLRFQKIAINFKKNRKHEVLFHGKENIKGHEQENTGNDTVSEMQGFFYFLFLVSGFELMNSLAMQALMLLS